MTSEYSDYECCSCGAQARNSYCEPHKTNMLERRLCWECNFWVDMGLRIAKDYRKMTIIGGCLYDPGNRTEGSFRGMGGRRFDIEYIGDSIYSGQRITTFDLWAGSSMPEALAAKYPDTARFLGGAERVSMTDGPIYTCWNSSDGKGEVYMLPRGLRPNV